MILYHRYIISSCQTLFPLSSNSNSPQQSVVSILAMGANTNKQISKQTKQILIKYLKHYMTRTSKIFKIYLKKIKKNILTYIWQELKALNKESQELKM